MAKEDFPNILGRALLDEKFAAHLQTDPTAAAKSIGITLSPSEHTALAKLSTTNLSAISTILKHSLGPLAILDQQQQQGRMA